MVVDRRPEGNPAGRAGLLNNVLALAGTLAVFFETRAALIAKESRSAFARLIVVAACLGAAALVFVLGYVFLIAAAVVALAHLANISWIWTALEAALLHFVLAMVLLLIARNRMTGPMFRASAEELKKDSEWLKNLGNQKNS
ncbi:MAG: hypothetical protein QOI04_2021 [Verrucomicrobiota bacterium]|jgi:hypothetical protein